MGEIAESSPAVEECHHGMTAAESPFPLPFPGGLAPRQSEEAESVRRKPLQEQNR